MHPWLLAGGIGTWNPIADRFQAAQVGDDGGSIGIAKSRETLPWHDRREQAAVWTHAAAYSDDDLLIRPATETGFPVWREIRADECAGRRNLKAHVRTAEFAGVVFYAAKVTRRMTMPVLPVGIQAIPMQKPL